MDQLLCILSTSRGEICHCRHCRRQCQIFASGVNFSIFTHFLFFFLLKLLKLGEIDGVKFLASKSGNVKFWTNSMSEKRYSCKILLLVRLYERSNCAKLTTTNWKWTEIFCQLRKRYYQKKYCSKTFNDIKNSMRRKLQPEGLDAAQFWCYWKFFEFSTNICHSPASQNGTKTEKSYREMSKIYFLQ